MTYIIKNRKYIFSNIASGITNNRTKAIVANEFEQGTASSLQIISNNIVNGDIISNRYTGGISNNIIARSIWNNIFLPGGGLNPKIINNKAGEIANNYNY